MESKIDSFCFVSKETDVLSGTGQKYHSLWAGQNISKTDRLLAEVQAWNWKIVDKKVAEFIAEGRKAGMHIYDLPSDELNRWKKQVQPLMEMYEPIVGKDIMDAIENL